MREIRPSGSEGGVAHTRHPYPYPSFVATRHVLALRDSARHHATPQGNGVKATGSHFNC